MKNILIVEDQAGIRFLLEEIIRNDGHHVSSYMNGYEALVDIEKGLPDLLILDYHLPIINGGEIVKQLESKGYLIPTILMSGLIDDVRKKTLDLKSVKAYFGKPFDVFDVIKQINALLK